MTLVVPSKTISDATVRAGALDELPFDKLRGLLHTHMFARVTGLLSTDEALAARNTLLRATGAKH
jgi:hypothetical protein